METCGLIDEVSEAIRLEYEIDAELCFEQYQFIDEPDSYQFELSEMSQENLLLCPYCRWIQLCCGRLFTEIHRKCVMKILCDDLETLNFGCAICFGRIIVSGPDRSTFNLHQLRESLAAIFDRWSKIYVIVMRVWQILSCRHKELCVIHSSTQTISESILNSSAVDVNLQFQQSEGGWLMAWCEICGYSDSVMLSLSSWD